MEGDKMGYKAEDVRKHYLRDEVKEILLESTELNGYRQALITGLAGWYKYRKKDGREEKTLKPFRDHVYDKEIENRIDEETRSLYWSTNFYDPGVFKWVEKDENKPGGYGTTGFYRLGIDIDLLDQEKLEELDRDRTINEAENREMLEKAGQFVIDWFVDHGLPVDVIRPYFSGNGLYITIDPSIVKLDCGADKAFEICEAFNAVIKQIEKEFFEEVEEADKYVQFDALNNASRAWKTILSIHKSQPYACIPLDPWGDELEIDLEKAKLPLSEEVIGVAKEWIRPVREKKRNTYTRKLGDLLKSEVLDRELFGDKLKRWFEGEDGEISPMEVAAAKRKKKSSYSGPNYDSLNLDLEDLEALKDVLPPCLAALIEEKTALSHARGKAVLAKTLEAVGYDEEKAQKIFNKLCDKKGPTTNIFESWFSSDMSLPSCDSVQTTGEGYPSLELGDLNLCEPDEKCKGLENPFEYIMMASKPEGVRVVEEAMENLNYDPERLGRVWNNEEQETYYYSAYRTLGDVDETREALNKIRRKRIGNPESKKNNIDKSDRKRVIAEAVRVDMKRNGKLLKGENGGKFYYYEPEKKVYRFHEIEPLLQRLYDISGSREVGNATKRVLKNAIENEGEEVKVRKTWYYNEDEKELYVYDKDRHYFILGGESIEKQPNGTNGIYFLFDTPEDSIEYTPEEERETGFDIPGQISEDFEAGDYEVNEYLANQTNFVSTTNLTEEEQRLQLLLHIYAFPFGDLLPAKPIMLFTGEKGSTKSYTLKKLGRFFMRSDFRCRPLPSEEDYYVAVTKNPLTFFDNVESNPSWLEDALAVVATEARVAKRKLYEDFTETKRDPETFLGLTAREIPFNRDDIMDRSLLFHVGRLDNYIGERKLQKPLTDHKDTLWSQYLDNLNKIVARLRENGIEDLESQHRLADWACLAIRIAEALGYDEDYDINRIFEKMETERAAYALKDDELYQTLKKAIAQDMLSFDEWIPANKIGEELRDTDQHFSKKTKAIGRELNSHEKEYNEIFGLGIKQQTDRKVYFFPSVMDPEEGECEECGMDGGQERRTERGETKIMCDSCYAEKYGKGEKIDEY